MGKIVDAEGNGACRNLVTNGRLSLRDRSIEWSREVRTACIECADRPRLLLNLEFVQRSCTTRERLTALILHELAHVSFGHTRLFPRPTPAHNVAFDALINATILAQLEARDPGVENWISTAELTQGEIRIRWQRMPPSFDPAKALRSFRKVAYNDIASELPGRTGVISPDARRAELETRARADDLRWTD